MSSRTFLLCPGFMTDQRLWASVEDRLRGLGDVIFVDQGRDDTIDAMAARALEGTPERFIAVGFSFGGYIARQLYFADPARVQGLIIVNSTARGDTEADVARRQKLKAVIEAHGFKGLSQASLEESLHPDRAADPALMTVLKDMGRDLGGAVLMRQLSVRRPKDIPRLDEIECPTLVIWSRQDRLRTLAEATEMSDGIPNAELRIVENSGHMLPMEQPDAFVDEIEDWLDRLEAR